MANSDVKTKINNALSQYESVMSENGQISCEQFKQFVHSLKFLLIELFEPKE